MDGMTIIKCDGCGQEIPREKDSISIGRGWLVAAIQLCATCGAPAATLLDRVAAKRRSEGREHQIEA